jgi:hypothetical protein
MSASTSTSTEAAFNELAREFFKQNYEAKEEFCQWLLKKDEQDCKMDVQEQEYVASAAGGAAYGLGRHVRFNDDGEMDIVNKEEEEEEEEFVDEDIDQNYIVHAMQQNEKLKDFTAAQLHYIKEHPDGVNDFVSRLNISQHLMIRVRNKIWRMNNPERMRVYAANSALRRAQNIAENDD